MSVTLLPDTEQPPFLGRARRPGNARAGSLVTGYHEVGQMPAPLSRKIGQKKQRLADSEQQQTPKERLLSTPGLRRSIYFSSPEDHSGRLGPEFFDQPAVTLARAFLGQNSVGALWRLRHTWGQKMKLLTQEVAGRPPGTVACS